MKTFVIKVEKGKVNASKMRRATDKADVAAVSFAAGPPNANCWAFWKSVFGSGIANWYWPNAQAQRRDVRSVRWSALFDGY